MVNYGETEGMRGLKQIYRAMYESEMTPEQRDKSFEKHTHHFLNRCFPDWMR